MRQALNLAAPRKSSTSPSAHENIDVLVRKDQERAMKDEREVEHKKATQSIRCRGEWLLLTLSPASRGPNPQFTSVFPHGEQDGTHACKIEEEL